MIRLEFLACLDRVLGLRLFREYLISSIIHRDYTEKSDCKLSVKIFPKVKSRQFLDMIQIQDSLRHTVLNTLSLSRKEITQLLNAKWSFNSSYISVRLESPLQINLSSKLLSSPINDKSSKICNNNLRSKR